jgi:hypothetical protein
VATAATGDDGHLALDRSISPVDEVGLEVNFDYVWISQSQTFQLFPDHIVGFVNQFLHVPASFRF